MRIAIICGFDFGSGTGWWGKSLPPNVLDLDDGPTVGGGEEAAIRAAEGLVRLGHEVVLWWYAKPGMWRGVEFRTTQHDLYASLQREKFEAVVAFSALQPLEWAPPGAVRIFAQQLNDLFQMGRWDRVDCIVSPSESHATQLPGWGWRGRPYAVVHNGLDAHLYSKEHWLKYRADLRLEKAELDMKERSAENYKAEWDRITECEDSLGYVVDPPKWEDRPMNVGYWSSPDRGLHHLLRAWPKVLREVPNAKLHVFYELERYLKSAVRAPSYFGDRARILEEMVGRAKADPSIVFHGAVPRNALRKTQFETRVMCYPYMPINYCEGFCGSVNQGIAAGCHVMTTPRDALTSLYGGAVTWLPTDPDLLDDVLATNVVRGLIDREWSLDAVRRAEPHRFNYTWERAAKEMENAILRRGWKNTAMTTPGDE